MPFVFAPPAQVVVPVQDERYQFLPVNRVFGVAKNYAEPGSLPTETPFYFMKSASCVLPVAEGEIGRIPMPPGMEDMRHEIELVACLSKGGRNLTREEAMEAVWGWCAGIDFTLGDQKLPSGANDLTRAKAFERSAPVSHVRPAYRSPMPAPADLWLYVNNQKRQAGNTQNLIRDPYEVIAELSAFWELQPGDLIFTGTPTGIGRVMKGDRLEGGVNGVGTLKVEIV